MAYKVQAGPSLPESRREDPPSDTLCFFFFLPEAPTPPASQTRGGSRRLQVEASSAQAPTLAA